MKGIVRRLDEVGRLTIPIEIRRTAKINSGDVVGLEINGNIIRIRTDVHNYIGMTRPFDDLGRVVLPKEIRKSLKFNDHELIDMWIEDDEICLRKATLQCVICGCDDEKELVDVDGVLICRSCGAKFVDKFKG